MVAAVGGDGLCFFFFFFSFLFVNFFIYLFE